MIGIVLVTHGNLAREFKSALEHVVGPQENMIPVSIMADDDMQEKHVEVEKAVQAVNQGEGVILLTDLFGGTPSNMAISMMQCENVEVIAGMNLPMLVKLASLRGKHPIAELSLKAQEAARKNIHVASQILTAGN